MGCSWTVLWVRFSRIGLGVVILVIPYINVLGLVGFHSALSFISSSTFLLLQFNEFGVEIIGGLGLLRFSLDSSGCRGFSFSVFDFLVEPSRFFFFDE
jgi:hypothetical protein